MISPKCEARNCGQELDDFGAIILSPPMLTGQVVRKIHICKKCYKEVFYPLLLSPFESKDPIIDPTGFIFPVKQKGKLNFLGEVINIEYVFNSEDTIEFTHPEDGRIYFAAKESLIIQ